MLGSFFLPKPSCAFRFCIVAGEKQVLRFAQDDKI